MPLLLRCARGRLALELRLLPAGRDWQLLLTGGEAHIGAVVLAEPVAGGDGAPAGSPGTATNALPHAKGGTPAGTTPPGRDDMPTAQAPAARIPGQTDKKAMAAGTPAMPPARLPNALPPAAPLAASLVPADDPALTPASSVVADGVRLRVLQRTRHHDHKAALPLARDYCRALGTTVCVSAGIHYESISRKEIAVLLAMCRLLGARGLRRLRALREEYHADCERP